MPKKKTWWVELEFNEFCIHYMNKKDDDIVKDVKSSVESFMSVNPEGENFGAKMVRKANEAMERVSETNRRNANKRWNREHDECPLPKNKEEVRLFAVDHGLDVDYAMEWAELSLKERKGRDKAGNPIKNWKGALINYVKSREGNADG